MSVHPYIIHVYIYMYIYTCICICKNIHVHDDPDTRAKMTHQSRFSTVTTVREISYKFVQSNKNRIEVHICNITSGIIFPFV